MREGEESKHGMPRAPSREELIKEKKDSILMERRGSRFDLRTLSGEDQVLYRVS